MGRTTQLRAVLKSGFYSPMEAQGFVCDKRHQPQFTCFRRMTDTVVQAFDVQWDKYGRPRFVINFTEAPLDGFEYFGEHIPAAEAWPGHRTLAGGRLAPGRSGSWFRLDRPMLSRLLCMQLYYDPNDVVAQVITLFPEIVAWWERKIKGPHIRLHAPELQYSKPKS